MAGNEGFNPNGLRILVVDDSEVQLLILKHMLVGCCYNVTTTNRAEEALAMLREHPDNFDLVLSDVMMPDMDGFKLLEMIGLTMDLPVIMMSANAETSVVMKGITHGACDYLIKPVRIEELKNIWQHVIRKRVKEHLKDETVGDSDDTARTLGEQDQFPKKRKEKFTAQDEQTEDINSLKKARVLWSKELHEQFVQAVNHIGIDKAVPTRILEVMNVQGLTRENVASHLQKYRMYLKRLSGIPLQPHPVASFKASGSGGFGGVMHIQPGGKVSAASSGPKGVNLGSAPNSNLGRGGGGGAPIDQSTLLTLSQLQERQRAGAPITTATNAGQISMGSNVRSAASCQFHPLQRLSSAELDNLMLAAHEDCVAQQQLNCIPLIKDDLGSLPGLGTMRIGEDMSVLAGLGNLGSGEMGTLVDFRTSKMEHVEVAAVGELGLDKFRDFGSPSPFSTVSTMSGGLGSESSFGTYTEFAAGREFLASSPPEFGQPVEGGLFQSKGDRSRAGGGVPYGSHSSHSQEEFARHN